MSSVISNPPFNISWEIPLFAQAMEKFIYGVPPASNANFAFMLTGLNMITERSIFILPNQITTSKNKDEEFIREQLVKNNILEAVITCPENMFESTGVAVSIVVLNKNKKHNKFILIDAKKESSQEIRFQKGQFGSKSHTNRVYEKNFNIFSDENIKNIIDIIENQKEIKDVSVVLNENQLKEKKYNWSASYYFEIKFEIPEHRPFDDIINDLNYVITQKNCLKLTINEKLAKGIGLYDIIQMINENEKITNELNVWVNSFSKNKIFKNEYITVSKNKNEIKFENKSDSQVSTIILSILQMYKQHLMFLNNVENKYLIELRDALLPELISGKLLLDEEQNG